MTDAESRALAEYVIHGSHGLAAACRGISRSTQKNEVSSILRKTGALSAQHAAFLLGWTRVPVGLAHGA